MTITPQQLSGNWGEQYVAQLLAAQACLVRHVPQGHDVGIDLYCETTIQGIPWLHFWFQVKVREDISGEEEQISRSVDGDHLLYWLRQPIPVFVVYVAKKAGGAPPIYVCPIGDAPQSKLTSGWRIESAEDMRRFIEEALPLQIFLWDLRQGKVGFIQPPSYSYTVRIPVGYAQHFEDRIHGNLDRALCRLSEDLLKTAFDMENLQQQVGKESEAEEAWKVARPYMEALRVIVAGRGATGFFEHVNIGVMAELDGDLKNAHANYGAALASIDGDARIPQLPDPEKRVWKDTRAKIERHLGRVHAKLQTGTPTAKASSAVAIPANGDAEKEKHDEPNTSPL